MATLAQELGEVAHVSPLKRSAERLSLFEVRDYVSLAVLRGCKHYGTIVAAADSDPGLEKLSNEELVGLLLLPSNEFDPIAIRCAAQLATKCDANRLAAVARRERSLRSLAYIAEQGRLHDAARPQFWADLMTAVGAQSAPPAGLMPHWSRFVSQTGYTQAGSGEIRWLSC